MSQGRVAKTVFRLAPSLTLMTAALLTGLPARAALPSSYYLNRPVFDLSAGVENFRWQEFDGGGQRLLTEQGPRPVVSGGIDFSPLLDPFVLRAMARAYSGVVNYDGQVDGVTSPRHTFVSSETDYRGGQLEAQMGFRWQASPRFSFEVLGGAGAEAWRRDIANSIDASGQPVGGFREEYRVFSGHLGLGMDVSGTVLASSLQLGARFPFQVDEDFVFNGARQTLHPDGRWSVFVHYRVSVGQGFIAVSYDSFRFGASPVRHSVFQPKSNMDVFGIRLGREF